MTVPIYASIGCSYAKCTFCAIDKMSGNFHGELGVRKKNGIKFLKGKNGNTFKFYRETDKILQEMIEIQDQYNVSYFSFNDETLDMDFALEFSEDVIKQDHKIYWQAFARVEDELTSPEFCNNLYQGGCRLLRIGFEYLSQDMLDRTHKGYSLKKQKIIAENLNQAGIWIHAYFMIGTEEDFRNALDFFQRNPEFYELFHTLEFFSQVDDRHSLENIEKLSKGAIDNTALDIDFPQFRIWYDKFPRARNLVERLKIFAQDRFIIHGNLSETSEVAYFPNLSCTHGLENLKKSSKESLLAKIDN